MMGSVVVGIGNPSRGDDGVGHAVIDALPPVSAQTLKLGGEATELMDLFEADCVIIVDALLGPEPGEVRVFDGVREGLPQELVHASTHSFGLAQAVELGRALGQLPQELWVVGIAGARFEHGYPLSTEARDGIGAAVDIILEKLGVGDA